ncbi:MAG: ABC transporter permease subunit [Thermomicrobiaceae bacterium]
MSGRAESHLNPNQSGEPAEGHVYRRKYTQYEGHRQGRGRSYIALIVHSLRRALGIRRKWTSKILPIFLYGAAFIPVIGFIAIPAIVGIEGFEFGSADLFSALSMILLIFAAAAAPEMLCDDRRENVLPLYYSRGLSRWDYLAAKMLSLGGIMLSVSLLPATLLFLGNTFLQDAPFSYLSSNADEFPRIVATAFVLSLYYSAVGLAVASMTERKGVASAIVIGVFLAGSAIANGLYESIDQSWSSIFVLIAMMEIPDGILVLMFDYSPSMSLPVRSGIEPLWFLASIGGFTLVSALLLYRRYLRED